LNLLHQMSLLWLFFLLILLLILYTIYWLLVPKQVDYSKYTKPPFDRVALKKILREITVQCNGAEYRIYEAGPPDGKLIIFLHGFPETALSAWPPQITYFASKGYLVVAPDIRGFGDSKITHEKYSDGKLGAYDVAYFIESHYKREKAIIVGHDWGGSFALNHSYMFPNQVEKLVLLNMPHTEVYRKAITSNLTQIIKSYYVFLFQVKGVAEWKLRQNDWSNLVAALDPEAFALDTVNILKAYWEKTIGTQLACYRSALKKTSYDQLEPQFKESKRKPNFYIVHPTLFLFGKKDVVIDWHLVNPSLKYVKNGKVIFYENVTHWIQHLEPEKVNADIDAFIST